MNAYFEFLSIFLLLFALIYTLAYLPGVPRTNTRIQQNAIFLLSFGLIYVFSSTDIHASYLWAFGVIFLLFNLYLPFAHRTRKIGTVWRIFMDLVICSLVLFASSCVVAITDNLPIKIIIHERFSDGSYSFSPGYLDEMISNSFIFSFIVIHFKYGHRYILRKWEERQERKYNKLQSQKKNIEIQFEALQSKVNPHFLYNSLNSIAGLATVDGTKTRQMALALSRFFQYSMNREQEIMITAEEEVEMIETYLEIEKIRFGELLNYIIELPDDLKPYKMPRMLLQPVIENCIKHGMKNNTDPITVHISFSHIDHALLISVKDNGTPFEKNFIPGYGIQSVYDKLELLFPDKYKIELNTHPVKDFSIYLYE